MEIKEQPSFSFDKWQKAKMEKILLSKQRAMEVKEDLNKKIPAIFQKYNIKKAFLFGSLLENRFFGKSDIDLYVEPLSPKKFFEMQFELEESLNLPVDLYYQKDDPVFIKKIQERGQVIYEI